MKRVENSCSRFPEMDFSAAPANSRAMRKVCKNERECAFPFTAVPEVRKITIADGAATLPQIRTESLVT